MPVVLNIFFFTVMSSANAGTFGFSPSVLSFEKVKASNILHQTIKVTGPNDLSYTLNIKNENPMYFWIKVGTALEYGDNNFEIPLAIYIPKETKSALYESSIELLAKSKAEAKEGTNVSANFSHVIPLKINVTNEDNIDINTNWFEIPTAFAAQKWGLFRLKGGMKIIFELENKGNVASAYKKIIYKIYQKKDGIKLLEFTKKDNESVEAFTTRRILTSVSHSFSEGTYFAVAEFYREGQYKPGKIFETTFTVGSKTFSFLEKLKRIFL